MDRVSSCNIYTVQQDTQSFLMIDFYSSRMLARHISDLTGPSSGAFLQAVCADWYVVMRVLLDTSSRYEVTLCILLDCIHVCSVTLYLCKSHFSVVGAKFQLQISVRRLLTVPEIVRDFHTYFKQMPGRYIESDHNLLHSCYFSPPSILSFFAVLS